MINLKSFMENVGVSKKAYVQEWIEKDLIPGVVKGKDFDSTLFPDSARRPYQEKGKISPNSDADTLRAHILKAALKRQHISHQMCRICADEFNGYVNDLVNANLIRLRKTEGIAYYDSTPQSFHSKTNKIGDIRNFVIDSLAAISKGIAEGATTAILNKAS